MNRRYNITKFELPIRMVKALHKKIYAKVIKFYLLIKIKSLIKLHRPLTHKTLECPRLVLPRHTEIVGRYARHGDEERPQYYKGRLDNGKDEEKKAYCDEHYRHQYMDTDGSYHLRILPPQVQEPRHG